MSVSAAVVSVGNASAALLVSAFSTNDTTEVWLQNTGSNPVYLGSSTVTNSTGGAVGYKLAAGASIGPIPLIKGSGGTASTGDAGSLYAICDAAQTSTVAVLQAVRVYT